MLTCSAELRCSDADGEACSNDGAKELSGDEEQTSDDTGAACQQHGERHDWVEMRVADMTHAVDDRRVRQPKR